MSNRRLAFLVMWCVVACVCARAQDDANQRPLGEVARNQKNTQQKRAVKVIGDEDIAGALTRTVWGDFATQVIIPNVRISAKAPLTVKMNIPYGPEQKAFVWFGPDLNRCFDLECAKATYLRDFHYALSGTPKILFEMDDSIDGYPARIAHLELKSDVRGKMLGVVALIATPFSSSAPTCLYLEKDSAEMESACEEFINSLELHIPERYIYVQHPSY
jgi:hypothetical protein